MIELLQIMFNYFKYRKIKKEVINFIDYDDIYYGSSIILIQLNTKDDFKYYDWGEINRNIIRIRSIKNISLINQDLKKYYNKDRYRKEKLKRLIK